MSEILRLALLAVLVNGVYYAFVVFEAVFLDKTYAEARFSVLESTALVLVFFFLLHLLRHR